MNRDEILREIDAEIGRLQQARDVFAGRVDEGQGRIRGAGRRGRRANRRPGRTGASQASPARGGRRKRTISAEGRARIAAAQKRRWAKQKQGRSEAA